MTEQVRYRIEKGLVRRAGKVCRQIGVTPGQAVSMLFAAMANSGELPFRPSEFPASESSTGDRLAGQLRRTLDGLSPDEKADAVDGVKAVLRHFTGVSQ